MKKRFDVDTDAWVANMSDLRAGDLIRAYWRMSPVLRPRRLEVHHDSDGNVAALTIAAPEFGPPIISINTEAELLLVVGIQDVPRNSINSGRGFGFSFPDDFRFARILVIDSNGELNVFLSSEWYIETDQRKSC